MAASNASVIDINLVYSNHLSIISSYIIAVVTKNATVTQVKAILTKLTHNATGGRISNNVTVSTASLYLLHLPNDILSASPTFVLNAGMGEGPDYLSPLGIISDIAGMAFGFLVWVASGGLLLLFVHLVEIGLKAIGNLLLAYVALVEAAVDAIVDAFCAFTDWIIKFICDSFTALIAAPLQALYNVLEQWATGFLSLLMASSLSIESGESNASASLELAMYVVNSDFFTLLMAISLSLFIVITAASMMGPFAFIGSLVVPCIINLLICGMTAAAFHVQSGVDAITWIAGTIWDILGDDLVVGMAGIMGATMGTIGWLASLMSAPVLGEGIGFVLSSIGAFLSWWGTIVADWTTSLTFDVIGMAFALIGTIQIFKNPNPILLKNPTVKGILMSLAIGELGISAFELISTVASYE